MAESFVRPARAAKRERAEKPFNWDRWAAFDRKTNVDSRFAVDPIGIAPPTLILR
jgi:hypothetical protein